MQPKVHKRVSLVAATHNEGKLVEIRRILADDLGERADRITVVSAGSLGLPDPVETGVSFDDNALLKARDVAARTGLPALADDSGLIVDVMGGAPGIFSARWSGVHGDDRANTDLLLRQIADIPDHARTARFRCAAALVVPPAHGRDAPIETVGHGQMPGRVIRERRGAHGFGYDPIFVPDEQPERSGSGSPDRPLTSAELSAQEKNAISHRGRAIRALIPAIARLLD